jgi:putative FmdB family regulatory protein
MPTYEYVCPSGHAFEKFQKMTERPRAKCPTCGKTATRKISGGAALVFKGSGFYITDYGKDGKGPRKAESEPKPAEVKSEAKSESGKSESGKSESGKSESGKKPEPAAKPEAAPAKPAPRGGRGKASDE